ncbi:unnamed protein product, partial [Allacma fusca]
LTSSTGSLNVPFKIRFGWESKN